MEVNWIIIGMVVVFAILLVLFLIRRNWKDEKNLEVFLNENDLSREDEVDEDLNDRL